MPSISGVSFGYISVLDGRLPGNILCGVSALILLLVEPLRLELGDHLVLGLAQHQRFGLRQDVGDQLVVMRRQVLVRLGGDQEVARG